MGCAILVVGASSWRPIALSASWESIVKPTTKQTLLECFRAWTDVYPEAMEAKTETEREELFGGQIGVSGTTVRNWIGRSKSKSEIRENHALTIVNELAKYRGDRRVRIKTREFIRRYDHDYPKRSAEKMWRVLGEEPKAPLKPGPQTIFDLSWIGNRSTTVLVGILCLSVCGIILSFVPDIRPLLLSVTGLLIVTSWLLEDALSKSKNRDFLQEFLHDSKYASVYRAALTRLLSRFDHLFMRKWQIRQYTDKSLPRAAWTITLFSRTLLFASLYPAIFMLYQWLAKDLEVGFGKTILLYDTNTIGKLYISIAFLSSFVLTFQNIFSDNEPKSVRFWVATGFAVFGAMLAAFSYFGPVSSNSENLTANAYMAFAITGILIVFAVLSHFKITEHIVGPTVGLAMAGSISAVGAGTIEAAAEHVATTWGLDHVLVDLTFAFGLNVVLAIVIGLPLTLLLKRILDRHGYLAPISYAVLPLVTVAAMALSVAFIERPDYFIVLGLIPIINAIFDFFSIGLTRWALRSGLKAVGMNTIFYSVLDLFAALLIFLALGCSFIVVFHFVNGVAEWVSPDQTSKVLDFRQKFQQISLRGDAYLWLYWSFLTTLIPTLFHASVAVWAIGPALLPESVRKNWIAQISDWSSELGGQLTIVLPIALWSSFSILSPILLTLVTIKYLYSHSCEWGTPLLEFFASFYRFIGGHLGPIQFVCG